MQRPIAIMLSFVLFAFLATEALAHGGGLDRYGCHRETATGGYHCHNDEEEVDWGLVAGVVGGLITLVFVLRWLQPDNPTYGLQLSVDADGTTDIGYPIGNSHQIGIRSIPSTEGDNTALTYWRLRF